MTMSAAPAESRPDAESRPGTRPAATYQYRAKPAPRREPPFDDELPERHLSLVGPLDQPLPLEGFGRSAPHPTPVADDESTVRPTGRYELPEPAVTARRLVIGVVEIATGRRSHPNYVTTPARRSRRAWFATPAGSPGWAPCTGPQRCIHCTSPNPWTGWPRSPPCCGSRIASGRWPCAWKDRTADGGVSACRSAEPGGEAALETGDAVFAARCGSARRCRPRVTPAARNQVGTAR